MWGELLKLGMTVAEYGVAAQRRHLPAATLCFLLGAGFATTMIGCLIAALWIYLVPYVGPFGAPLIVAAVTLILALVLFVIGWRQLRRRPPTGLPSRAAFEAGFAEVKTLIGEHKSTMLLAAAIAGLVLGSGRRRR